MPSSVHDTVDLEIRGIPSAFVATTEFHSGADVQAKALGASPFAIYVPHPIQDRTDAELQDIADESLDEIIAALVAS